MESSACVGDWKLRLAIALILVGLLSVGCQAGGATHTIVSETPFYLDGPQQARSADGLLAAGTRVTLVSSSGSYSQVVLPNGRRAYVAADRLSPLR
jgi:hypothetical protein